jgi:hypothetical protein
MNASRFIAALSLATLAACSSGTVKDTLGLNRASPDEFRVMSRPPLSIPPDFTLRPPDATQAGPGQLPASAQAQSLVTGGAAPAKPTAKTTSADAEFLKAAGATQADPNVRHELVEENTVVQQKQEDSNWWDILSTNPPKKDTVVNAGKEAERIETNSDSGKPVTEGDTPVVKDRDTGVLGRILGY